MTVSGLRPASFYVVRVALVTNFEFSSKSTSIRFRTKPESTADFFHSLLDGHDTDHDAAQEPLLRIKPYRGLKDIAPASADTEATSLVRESSSLGRRRSTLGKRMLSSNSIEHKHDANNDEPDAERDTVQRLTERLDSLRQENEEADRMARDEEEEEQKLKEELVKERDELRAEVADKEKASRNLKREVNIMERQNTASQNDRTKHERLLQQKVQERQKLKEDMVRWAQEIQRMNEEVKELKEQKVSNREHSENEKVVLRRRMTDETAAIKALEEDIKETTAEIKKVDRTGKNASPDGSDGQISLVEQLQHDAEEERQRKMQILELQQQYTATAQRLEQSKRFYAANMQFLEGMRERRRMEEAAAVAAASMAVASGNRDLASPVHTQERLPSRRDSQRSRRGTSGGVSDSPRVTTFTPHPVFGGGISSSGFSSQPLFAFSNGLDTITTNDGIPEEDREKLTAGALMSPGAAEGLLPADLFASDDKAAENVLPLPGLGSLPGLPGLGQQPVPHDQSAQGPASPVSISSKPASAFASPQASVQNLHHHLGSPEALVDNDGRSIRSNRSGKINPGNNAGSRFSAMFGIRPRTKQSPLEDSLGVPLGKTHSHSMPRQDKRLPGLDEVTRKRNSSLSGSAFANFTDEDDSAAKNTSESPIQPRKKPFTLNPFGKDKSIDGWPSPFSPFGRRPVSPRPDSTHSSELPRPSFDSTRWGVDTWPSNDSGSGARASPLSLGGWTASVGQTRHQSRRPSMQQGHSSHDHIPEDEDSDALDPDVEPQLAPIGTKPSSSKQDDKQVDTKLNPNAKDFKSFLSSMRLRDKEKVKASESASKTSTPGPSATTPTIAKDSVDDDSPPRSRRSRDAPSPTPQESSVSGSRRNSSELVLSPSYSNSEAANSPQVGSVKGSFMQKLTRKSSSGKFSLPTFKREKSKLEVQSPALPPFEDDEDAMSASVGSLREPRESSEKGRGSSRNWSNVLKIGKKKGGGETPSVSELSTASETTGDDGMSET